MCQARRRLLGPLRTLPERHFGGGGTAWNWDIETEW